MQFLVELLIECGILRGNSKEAIENVVSVPFYEFLVSIVKNSVKADHLDFTLLEALSKFFICLITAINNSNFDCSSPIPIIALREIINLQMYHFIWIVIFLFALVYFWFWIYTF